MEEDSSVEIMRGRNGSEQLAGTVKLYGRHIFVCSGVAEWPERVEAGGGFSQALAEGVAPSLEQMALKVKLTVCDEPSIGRPGNKGAGRDLLVFPDAIRYFGVRESEIPSIVQEHLVGGRICSRVPSEALSGWHVFVCVHGARDERCGLCGPPLVERFQIELESRGLLEKVAVRRSSHVGGHRYAGNVLIYPGGDWYGFVSPKDVPKIVEGHLEGGELVSSLWRGRMGMTPQAQVEKSVAWQRAERT